MSSLTFKNFDAFDLQPFAEQLIKLITIDYAFSEDGAYVVSLNASMGSGKTTFLEMLKNHLEQKEFTVHYINAWETDFADDPIIPIISSLLEQIKDDKLKGLLVSVLGTIGLSVNQLITNKTGLNFIETAKNLSDHNLEKLGGELNKSFQTKLQIYKTLRKELAQYVKQQSKKPIFILVDELDRARANYSIEFLEAIKHIFSVHGIVFILAIDKQQLQSSIKHIFGSESDVENYLLRFVDRNISLPPIEKLNRRPFIKKLLEKHINFGREKNLHSIVTASNKDGCIDEILDFANKLKLSLRQIERAFRVLSYYLSVEDENKVPELYSNITAAIFLILLSSFDAIMYYKLGNDQLNAADFKDFLLEKKIYHNEKHYPTYPLILASTNTANEHQVIDTIYDLFHNKDTPMNRENIIERVEQDYSRYVVKYGRIGSSSSFAKIYKRIEECKKFFDD